MKGVAGTISGDSNHRNWTGQLRTPSPGRAESPPRRDVDIPIVEVAEVLLSALPSTRQVYYPLDVEAIVESKRLNISRRDIRRLFSAMPVRRGMRITAFDVATLQSVIARFQTQEVSVVSEATDNQGATRTQRVWSPERPRTGNTTLAQAPMLSFSNRDSDSRPTTPGRYGPTSSRADSRSENLSARQLWVQANRPAYY